MSTISKALRPHHDKLVPVEARTLQLYRAEVGVAGGRAVVLVQLAVRRVR